jgi:Zn-dependent M28 family amino/carboxypeptidase
LRDAVSAERLRADLAALPAPRHRRSEPIRMEAAEQVVESALRAAGWDAARQPFARGSNVVALRDGAERPAVAVLAHLDTVAGSGGADDNGSGVVALVELARLLAPFRLRRSVLLAAVDLEETGRFEGTEALIHTFGDRLVGAIVFECLAYTDPRPNSQQIPAGLAALYPGQLARARAAHLAGTWTLVVYRSSGLPLARAFADGLAATAGADAVLAVRDPLDLPLIGPILPFVVPTVRHFARSDHVALWRHGIPAIQVTDTANLRNARYHTAFDTPDGLDYPRLADTVVATALAVCRLAGVVDQ